MSFITRLSSVFNSVAADVKELFQSRMMSFHLENPTVQSKKIVMGKVKTARTISQINAVAPDGNGTSSVTIKFFKGTDVSATGTAIINAGLTISNNSTGHTFTSFDNAAISADDFIWFQITAKSGTINDIAVSIWF